MVGLPFQDAVIEIVQFVEHDFEIFNDLFESLIDVALVTGIISSFDLMS